MTGATKFNIEMQYLITPEAAEFLRLSPKRVFAARSDCQSSVIGISGQTSPYRNIPKPPIRRVKLRCDVVAYDKQTYRTDWDGIVVSVTYAPDWLNMSGRGVASAHLEIMAIEPERARLPISETGYRSLFTQAGIISVAGGPVAYALAWLENAAKEAAWIKYKVESAQLELF